MDKLDEQVGKAVRHFWTVRNQQANRQGAKSGQRDAGFRTAVTGGKHMDGFVELCRDLLVESGISNAHIHWRSKKQIPGYYRAEKDWDLLAVVDGHLLAVVEFKAQVGPSFGNNCNNRTEEALGNATDLWAAYREGAFKPSQRPWLGYVFILEDCPKSNTPVSVKEPHFKVFEDFRDASYAERYEIFLMRLLRERLYDGVSLLLSTSEGGLQGEFRSPNEELTFRTFAASLLGHAVGYAKLK